MKMYSEMDYANNRLGGTVVRYGGKAITVIEISSGGTVAATYVTTGDPVACDVSELDITPVPLGYVNTKVDAKYAVRMPMREDWRQGLRENNARTHDGMKLFTYTNWHQVGATIDGVFPPFEDCYKAIKVGKTVARAFSRNFAIHLDGLQYKGRFIVGDVLSKDQEVKLSPKFEWLEDVLKMEMVHA